MNIDHEEEDRQMTSRILILTIKNAQLICKIHQVYIQVGFGVGR